VAPPAERFGASRTPVREALLVLERDGVVRFERNLGVRVSSRLHTTSTDRPAAARAGGRGGDRVGWEESRF
jgi:DNA-binding FadR family transcriptional regulator